MTEQPLVSVFIPYYNDEKFLKQSIESVLNNDYQNFELVLLNHATTDSCREIAHSYDDNRIIHIDMDKNYGAGGGLLFSKLLDVAKGKYIKPLCADDMLAKNGLTDLVCYMESHPNKDFAFGNIEYMDEFGEDLNENWFESREFFSVDNDEADCIRLYSEGKSFLPWIGSIIKRDILYKIPINKTFVMTFDMYIWSALLCSGYKLGYLDEKIAKYRIHKNQVSAIEKEDIAGCYSYFELRSYVNVFFLINSVELAKKVWKDCKFNNKLTDKSDLDFYIAYNLFINDVCWGGGATILDQLLNDDAKRAHIAQVFGYDIKDFRADMQLFRPDRKLKKGNVFKRFKQKIYSKPVKKLGLRDMSFLIIHRLYNIITLSDLRTKLKERKNKKRYSL